MPARTRARERTRIDEESVDVEVRLSDPESLSPLPENVRDFVDLLIELALVADDDGGEAAEGFTGEDDVRGPQ